jgi:glutamyl-tRNA synthetase
MKKLDGNGERFRAGFEIFTAFELGPVGEIAKRAVGRTKEPPHHVLDFSDDRSVGIVDTNKPNDRIGCIGRLVSHHHTVPFRATTNRCDPQPVEPAAPMQMRQCTMPVGRFAPSPTGDLHLGNLRTALVAWLFARSTNSAFLVRMEDLDPITSSRAHERQQLDDLAAIGLDWDGEVVRQSDRFPLYENVIAQLAAQGRTYLCFCSRREIAEAASAPHHHLPDGAYPGTCRDLPDGVVTENIAQGKKYALRIRMDGQVLGFVDRLRGPTEALVDDFVLRRADGMPAYNLAVVVDDEVQGIEEIVRGDDLLLGTPRQIALGRILGYREQSYVHVPLVLNAEGKRLAKRDGAVTVSDLKATGVTPEQIRSMLAHSLGLTAKQELVSAQTLLERFNPDEFPRESTLFPESSGDLRRP